MKFKNYRNSHTNEDKIYSRKNIADMSVREAFSRKDEIMAQHNSIGIPSEGELQSSPNTVWVDAYTRDDGTEVRGHWRSKPESNSNNENNSDNNELKEDNNAEITKINDTPEHNEQSKYIKPVEGKITSDFGYRKSPTQGASTNHSGIDIGVPVGTPVKAMADGTVTAANGGMRGYGNGVFIDHGMINGKRVVSEYGHLSSFDVKVGDKIKRGQVVAKSGNSGISSGPHLHITVREDKVPVDPKKYLGDFSN